MANSTLQNLKDSAFVRTDPILAVRTGRNLLRLPDDPFNVYDPSSGEGDFFYVCAHVDTVRYFGTEISAERAGVSRQHWPHATILTSAFEAVSVPAGCMDLVLTNPPYFLQNGKRAEYRFIADAGESLKPGGIMVAIIPARSAWDGTMINHWLKWYDNIRVWKFPHRTSKDQEGAFDDYTQIVVIGARRADPQIPSAAEKKRLQSYQWREPEKPGQSGWKYETPPPDLPTEPIADPYRVPSSREVPKLVVRNADEATLLYTLDKSGAHFAPTWQTATEWPEEGYLGAPAMPYTGEAHIAAEVMIGGLDGELVYGPGTGDDAVPHIFTAFVGQEWVKMPVEDELVDKLREQGCIRVEMRQLQDKPILGVLNLHTGSTRYYQSEEVFTFLQPWLSTLAARVIEKRKPLYRLDPADWEIRLLSQFGTDKRLPKATFPGLAVAQMHRVFAMCRAMDVRGRTAIQGEPGTGKTRLATATAARQAYRWRHRTTEFRHTIQPAWIRGLRQAWLKNPRTLAMLGLEPVYGWRIGDERKRKADVLEKSPVPSVIAYRELASGKMIAPEDAGPKALPVLITTPLKVTKEYGKEILAAFPMAEVVSIDSHRDIPRWLERCISSGAPVVFGIFSHSTTRAFGREWQPAVREKLVTRRVPDLHPSDDLLDELEPVYENSSRKQKIVGYRFRGTDRLLTKTISAPYYYCYDCGGLISAVPGRVNQPDEEDNKKQGRPASGAVKAAPKEPGGKEEKGKEDKEPVTSITWFTIKQRWCTCSNSKRNQERSEQGKPSLKSPLWTDDRLASTRRKYPSSSFASWSAAMASLSRDAARAAAGASVRELAEHARRDDALLARLVEVALLDPETVLPVLELVARIDGSVSSLQLRAEAATEELGALLLCTARHDAVFLQSQVRAALDDEALFDRLIQAALRHTGVTEVYQQFVDGQQGLRQKQAMLVQQVGTAIHKEQSIVLLVDLVVNLLKDATTRELLLSNVVTYEPAWAMNLQALEQQQRDHRTLLHLLTRVALRHESFCTLLVRLGMQGESALAARLLEGAREADPTLPSLAGELQQEREHLLGMVIDLAGQNEALFQEVLEGTLMPVTSCTRLLVTLARRDLASLKQFLARSADCESEVKRLAGIINECEVRLATLMLQAARRDSSQSILFRLVEQTRTQIDWHALYFRAAVDRVHLYSRASGGKARPKKGGQLGASMEAAAQEHTSDQQARDVRLTPLEGGPIAVEEPDLTVVKRYEAVRGPDGQLVAYQFGHQGCLLVPVFGIWSRRVVGYVDQQTGKVVTKKTSYGFRTPPADSFSPYDYLYTFYRGCIALSVVDESHNGRGRYTDIGHSHHFAMLSAQLRELTSGTHYGGDIIGFYHYWYRYNPGFWQRLGFGWNDAEQALSHYGVVQEWTKEFESDARKGSGQTDVHVSTVPAPGISAKLIPGLLEDLTYLTVLDVGAHMPPKKEIPKGISMNDPELERVVKEARQTYAEARQALRDIQQERQAFTSDESLDQVEREALLAEIGFRERQAKDALEEAGRRSDEVQRWANERNLADYYTSLSKTLEDLAGAGNAAARLAKGTVPRWYASLPCESPFEVYSTRRGDWGDKEEPELVVRTRVLAWDYLYPMERWLIETVHTELAEGRRTMIYFEQNAMRSKARRLEWVLKQFNPWTLPNGVEAEDRQQAIIDAVEQKGHRIVIVPYKRVNEGLNLQTVIDTIIWDELAMNLFMYYQASQRAWRLGKEQEVRIYLPFYVGTAAHTKLRKLGGQSGAAAAFAGEPAKGELIKHVGADQTTLARLSASLEMEDDQLVSVLGEREVDEDLAQIEANFARRNEELQEALKRGRVWFGLADSLPERLASIIALKFPDVWATMPPMIHLPEAGLYTREAEVRERELVVPALAEGSSVTAHETAPEQSAVLAAPTPTEMVEPAINARMTEMPEAIPVKEGKKARVEVIFGCEEDIRRVRQRRGSRPRRSRPRPTHPTQTRHIPSLVEMMERAAAHSVPVDDSAGMELRSLWDLDSSTTMSTNGEATIAFSSLATSTTTSMGTLWEQES